MPTTALHHVEHGTGVPVLALHGWMPDHRILHGCLEPVFATRPGFRRLYPDLPGMGQTAVGGVASSQDVLDSVRGFVDEHIGSEPFLVVGESYGGYLARALVRDLPDQVRGLAMVCPVGVLDRAARRVQPHQVLRAQDGVLDGVDPGLAASFAAMSVVQTRETLRRYAEEIQAGVALADEAALAGIGARWALAEDPDAPDLPPYTAPTLLLAGRQDASVGYLDQLELVERYPHASVAVLDVAGHNLQIEQPALFAALVAEWLERAVPELAPVGTD